MVHRLPTLLFALAFLSTAVLAATITFDPAQEVNCLALSGGCSFSQTTIWVGGVVPTYNDSAVIASSGTYDSPLQIYTFSGDEASPFVTSVFNLTLHNVSFIVSSNSSLIIGSIDIDLSSSLVIKNNSILRNAINDTNGYFTLSLDSSLTIESAGAFHWEGNVLLYGAIVTDPQNSIYWHYTVYSSLTASIEGFVSGFYFTVSENITVTFPIGLSVSKLTLLPFAVANVSESFNGQIFVGDHSLLGFVSASPVTVFSNNSDPAVDGTGAIAIWDSIVAFTNNKSSVFNGTVTARGSSSVTFQLVEVRYLDLGETVALRGDGLVLSGGTVITGTLSALGAGVKVTGFLTVFGSGSIVVASSSLTVDVSALLTLGSPTALQLTDSTFYLGGIVNGNITVPYGSSLEVIGSNGTVTGSVLNHGTVTASADNLLHVFGDYNQTIGGVFAAGLNSNSDPALYATNGSIHLDGKLQYTLKDKPFLKNSIDFLFAESDWNITGTFNGSATALSGSAIDRELPISYNTQKVYVKYAFHPSDVEVWMWVVLGVAIALIVGGGIALAIKCRRRVQYDPVR